jgi:hypothetical protein
VIDPVAEGLQQLPSRLVEIPHNGLCRPVGTQSPHLPVVLQSASFAAQIAEDLGDPALHDQPVEAHLKEAVLGRGVAQTEHRPPVRVGKHVRGSPWVPEDLHHASIRRTGGGKSQQ